MVEYLRAAVSAMVEYLRAAVSAEPEGSTMAAP